MSWNDAAAIAQIAQAFLVVVSFAFIIYQLRQNINLTKASNAQQLAEQAAAFNALLYQDSKLCELWYSYGINIDSMSRIDQIRYREMIIQWIIFHENIHYQWKGKLLDKEIYHSWEKDLIATVYFHNIEPLFSDISVLFPNDFGRKVTGLINDKRARVSVDIDFDEYLAKKQNIEGKSVLSQEEESSIVSARTAINIDLETNLQDNDLLDILLISVSDNKKK